MWRPIPPSRVAVGPPVYLIYRSPIATRRSSAVPGDYFDYGAILSARIAPEKTGAHNAGLDRYIRKRDAGGIHMPAPRRIEAAVPGS